MWVCKHNKCQYYEKYCYINERKTHFLLNTYQLNFWAKAIKKSNSTVTKLKPPCLVAEIRRATYHKYQSNKKNKTKNFRYIFNNLIYHSTYWIFDFSILISQSLYCTNISYGITFITTISL